MTIHPAMCGIPYSVLNAATWVMSWRLPYRDSSLAFPLQDLPTKVFRRHEGMTEHHAWCRVPHDLADSLPRLTALAMGGAILAVTLMAVGAYGCPCQRCLYGFTT